MPFHHKVNEGLVKCSDCHDVHGTFSNNNLKSTADQNMICTKCHTEMRGPFVYEHAPVKAEGCTGLPHAARFAECPAAEHAEHQRAVQPVPQRGSFRHGSRSRAGIVGQRAVHELPHLHSWFEHECGVSQIGVMEPCSAAIVHIGRGSHNRFARGFKVSMSATSFIQVRLHMKNVGWFSRLLNQQPSFAMFLGHAGGHVPGGGVSSLVGTESGRAGSGARTRR